MVNTILLHCSNNVMMEIISTMMVVLIFVSLLIRPSSSVMLFLVRGPHAKNWFVEMVVMTLLQSLKSVTTETKLVEMVVLQTAPSNMVGNSRIQSLKIQALIPNQ